MGDKGKGERRRGEGKYDVRMKRWRRCFMIVISEH